MNYDNAGLNLNSHYNEWSTLGWLGKLLIKGILKLKSKFD